MSARKDWAGQKYGILTFIRSTGKTNKYGWVIWEVKCDCGAEIERTANNIVRGEVASCGCMGKRDNVGRFWAKVDKSGPIPEHMPHLGPCWIWTGGKKTNREGKNYGEFYDTGSKIKSPTHRYAYILTNGEIPDGKILLHLCDNPPCCNPAHLQPGTDLDNQRDSWDKGRRDHIRGEGNPLHVLTEVQVREIRTLWASGNQSKEGLGRRYKVSATTITDIVERRSWKWMKDT